MIVTMSVGRKKERINGERGLPARTEFEGDMDAGTEDTYVLVGQDPKENSAADRAILENI
jgi:hypothetical protein